MLISTMHILRIQSFKWFLKILAFPFRPLQSKINDFSVDQYMTVHKKYVCKNNFVDLDALWNYVDDIFGRL